MARRRSREENPMSEINVQLCPACDERILPLLDGEILDGFHATCLREVQAEAIRWQWLVRHARKIAKKTRRKKLQIAA
jgi:hypothetical protein